MATLEFTTKIDETSNLNMLRHSIDVLSKLAPNYKRTRLLVSFSNIEDPNIFFKDIDLDKKPDNLWLNVSGRPKDILKLKINKESLPKWKNHLTITKLQDAIDYDSLISPIDFVVFRMLGDNTDELFEAYNILRAKKFDVDFANFKIREPFVWTSEIEEKIINFYTPLLLADYYYDEETQQVYNKAEYLPIKGFRPIYKFLYKYSYGKAYLNLEQLPNGLIRRSISRETAFVTPPDWRQPFTLDEFLELNSVHPDFEDIGFEHKNCATCPLNGECRNDAESENLFQATDWHCAEAKLASLPLRILRELPVSDEKKEWFTSPENRVMA